MKIDLESVASIDENIGSILDRLLPKGLKGINALFLLRFGYEV